jgi:hypothetical protein
MIATNVIVTFIDPRLSFATDHWVFLSSQTQSRVFNCQDFLLSVSLRPPRRRSDMVPHRDCNSSGRRQLGLRRVNPCSHGVHKGTNIEYRLLVAIAPAILVGLFRTCPVYAFRCVKSLVILPRGKFFEASRTRFSSAGIQCTE